MSTLAQLLPALGLIVGGLLLVRRLAGRGGTARGSGLRVSARAALSRTAAVAVVEVDGQRYLVGGADHHVSLLALLPGAGSATAPTTIDAAASVGTTALSTDAGVLSEGSHPLPVALHDLECDRSTGPRNGLVDRLRAMTVRTAVRGPDRAPLALRR